MSKIQSGSRKSKSQEARISGVAITGDCLTSRAGLAPLGRYLDQTGILSALEGTFSDVRKNGKGASVRALFKQVLCFMADGTCRHMTHFEHLAKDPGYAASIETASQAMVSSHAVKRFFAAFDEPTSARFRPLLRRLGLSRIQQEQPEVIVLGLDSMVLDNNDAKGREGCEPTYKKVLGFQPLHLTWGRVIIDADFRPGNVHCNSGDGAYEMIAAMVKDIRAAGMEQPIMVRLDAGFYDFDLLKQLDDLGVGVVMGARITEGNRRLAGLLEADYWRRYDNGRCRWRYADFEQIQLRRGTHLRVLYTHTEARDGQFELALDETTESRIVSNLVSESPVGEALTACGMERYLDGEHLVRLYHGRGTDELVHRHLKEFTSELLPFKRLAMNQAWYFTLLVAFLAYESFKEDALDGVVPIGAYPNTVRRKLIDIAGKIVTSGNRRLLKVTRSVWEALSFETLWKRVNAPPLLPA